MKTERVHYNRLLPYYLRSGQIVLTAKRLNNQSVVTKTVSETFYSDEEVELDDTPIIDGQTLLQYRKVVIRRRNKLLSKDQLLQQNVNMEMIISTVANGEATRDLSFQTPLDTFINRDNLCYLNISDFQLQHKLYAHVHEV